MKILVTGGAGFIGSHLCDALIERGHKLVVVDNLELGRITNIKHLFDSPNFEFVKCDVLDSEQMDKVFQKGNFDMIYHLAANSDISKGGNDPYVDYFLTFNTTFTILNYMKQNGVKKLFFASTSAIYGETSELLHENYGPLQPVSNYGAAKLSSEAFISAYSSMYDIQVWITRFPNVVGERFTHGVIFDFIQKLLTNPEELEVLGNGEQCKPYIYVRDLIEGILYVIDHASERYNVYMLGPDSCTKVKDIAKMVIEEMDLNAKIRYTGGDRGWKGDVPEFRYNLEKVNNLGWYASNDSDSAVRIAIQKALEGIK